MFPEDNQQDYFPTDELRRRQTLSGVFGPDQDELSTGDPVASVKPTNANLTPAEQQYQQISGAAPKQSDYKPSVLRRIGAALAGAGAGWRNPVQGVQVARDIDEAPYNRALTAWQQQQQAAQSGLKLDEQVQNRLNAQARANAAQLSAQARMTAANADEAWRQYQQAHQPWQPQTEEQAIDFAKAKQVPRNPTPYEEFMQSYQGKSPWEDYQRSLQLHSNAETPEEREKLERMRENAEAARESQRQTGETSRETMRLNQARRQTQMTPKNMEAAEGMAVQQLLRTHPQYSNFVKNGKVVTADQLPVNHWYNTTTDAQASLARTQYQQFLADLDKTKRAITGQGAGQTWEIKQEEE